MKDKYIYLLKYTIKFNDGSNLVFDKEKAFETIDKASEFVHAYNTIWKDRSCVHYTINAVPFDLDWKEKFK